METDKTALIVALTGATGSVYGLTLARRVLEQQVPLYLLISETGREVLRQETGRDWQEWRRELNSLGQMETPDVQNLGAAVSSGSFPVRGMVAAPCSMGALGRIAAGISGNLIERAADVCLKERRRLILLTRETPLSAIHLQNMLTVTQAGGIIMPPVPAFYTNPRTVEDLVDQTVNRVMDLLSLPVPGASRWQGQGSEKP